MSDVADWWKTSIIDMEPGRIELRGTPIQALIGNTNFVEMIWLMVAGSKPTVAEAKLLEAALVAAVDHGPQAPSIATARMAITCGVGLNNVMANGVNALGDVHGGAGEQAVELYEFCFLYRGSIKNALNEWCKIDGAIVPGFGHRFHKPVDPRAPRLLALAPLARGLFCLSRSVGILAHAWEQKQQGGRNKGPTPPAYRWTYKPQ